MENDKLAVLASAGAITLTVVFRRNVGRQSIGGEFGGSCLISFATSSVVTCSTSCSTGKCADVAGGLQDTRGQTLTDLNGDAPQLVHEKVAELMA